MKSTKSNNALAFQPMENLQSALNLSAAANAELKKRGEDLLKNVNGAAKSEKKEFAVDLSEFVQDCKDEVARMRSSRKPITNRLTALLKNFTLLENEIDPLKPGSIGDVCQNCLRELLRQEWEENKQVKEQLRTNYERQLKRIDKRKVSDEKKEEARLNARKKLLEEERKLSNIQIQKLPVPNDPLGFIELFKFWWEQKGQYLPQDDMERFFKLPLTFARQQAQKGVFIDSQYIEYQEEPLLLN